MKELFQEEISTLSNAAERSSKLRTFAVISDYNKSCFSYTKVLTALG